MRPNPSVEGFAAVLAGLGVATVAGAGCSHPVHATEVQPAIASRGERPQYCASIEPIDELRDPLDAGNFPLRLDASTDAADGVRSVSPAAAAERVRVQTGASAVGWDWNAIYREGRDFNHAPSRFLVEMTAGSKPGVALDVAMGQGRNSLYLASHGWRVTGVDTSEVGIRQAREAAASAGLPVEAVVADEDSWDYGVDRWDLVVLVYSGCDAKLVASLRRALRRGGLVVFEGFHKDAASEIGWATGEIRALFKDGFTVLRDEVVDEVSDWGNQRTSDKLVRFAARRL
jgi:hypothetical protein